MTILGRCAIALCIFSFMAMPAYCEPMVEIAVEITEINNSKASELGIQWLDTIQGGEISRNSGVIPAVLPDVPSLIDAGEWKRFTALTAAIKVLQTKGAAQVLSKPKLVTKSDTTATFLVGGEIPIVASGVGGGTINWKEYGLQVNILPKIVNASSIDVILTTEVSRLDWANAVAGNPAIVSRKASSHLIIKNGQTLALAGMLETTKEKTKTGIPLLMDIPVLGYLFSRHITNDVKTNILIFVTPRIIE